MIDDDRRSMLRILMRQEGVSQKDMANYLGISQKHLSMTLNGYSNMHEELWDMAARALGCRWEILLVPVDPPENDTGSRS